MTDSFGHWRNERQDYERREGQPFDDSSLIRRGYVRTTFNYDLADGTLLYQQNRYDKADDALRAGVDAPKKKFLPCRPVDVATFDRRYNVGDRVIGAGPRRVIFNWPAVVRAGPGSTVFVPEGEKKASLLIAAGLLATCVISHYWADECVAALTGYDCIVLEDHDEGGRKLSSIARDRLSRVAKSIRVVSCAHLWRHLDGEHARREPPINGGVDDWLGYGGDPAKLTDICREIPAEGAFTAIPHDFPDPTTLTLWDWLYGKHLLRATVSGTAAMGGTGKSTKAIVEALAMTSGKALLGVQVSRPLRVCLINLEDNRSAVNKRIAAAMKHYGLTPADIGDRLFIKAKGEIKIKIATQPNGRTIERNEALINGLIDFLVTNEIDVLSIDPFVKTHGIHENDNDGIQAVVECYDDVAEKANCALHIWHHTRKSGGGEVTIELARGAIAFVDACRSANILETMTKTEGQKLKIDKPSFYFREFNGKRNFAPPMDQSTWFKLISVEIDNGGPVFGDDVGVVTSWLHPGVKEPNLSPDVIARIKNAVGRELRWREYSTADMWVGKAIAPVLNLDPEDDKDAIKATVKKLLKKKVLKTVPGTDPRHRERTFVVVAEGETRPASNLDS